MCKGPDTERKLASLRIRERETAQAKKTVTEKDR